MEKKLSDLINKAKTLGSLEAKLIETNSIVFDPRSHLKCRFGCQRWGKYWTCPPHLELSQQAFMEAFSCYNQALLLKCSTPLASQKITLALEKEAMLHYKCAFSFAMVLCVKCEECSWPKPCRYPHAARPAMDAYGIDIGKTVAKAGFTVELDPKGDLLPSWYSLVLLN